MGGNSHNSPKINLLTVTKTGSRGITGSRFRSGFAGVGTGFLRNGPHVQIPDEKQTTGGMSR